MLSPDINALTQQAGLVCHFLQCSDPAEWLDAEEKRQVQIWTGQSQSLPIRQIGRYAYRIGERDVDFDRHLNPKDRISDRLLVK
ncbi:MAG: hypothetical protein PUK59_03195 [Actinomycetaceae bacterium]|nr:hypothetical protein [Actinomycetaceae bacterium]MDY5855294.1 hypothetical protein [Arcanobacterium sp.]